MLLDTNVCIRREDPKNVPRNIATLFRTLIASDILFGVHTNINEDLAEYRDDHHKFVFMSKLACYPCFERSPGMAEDSYYLNKVGPAQDQNDEIDNELLYEVYTGTVTHLVTDDSKMHAKAVALQVEDKVLTVDEAIIVFKRLFEKTSTLRDAFLSWDQAFAELVQNQALTAVVPLTGRAAELAKLHALLSDPNVRAIILYGIDAIGKTRLALEGTKHRGSETYFVDCDALQSFSLTDLSFAPISFSATAIVIVDELNGKLMQAIMSELSSGLIEYPKLIITTADSFFSPPLQDAVNMISLEVSPLSDQDALSLLNAAPTRLDFNTKSWLIQISSGIPGHLLEGATTLENRKKGASAHASLANELGKAAAKSIQKVLESDDFAKLQLLSILPKVGVARSARVEIELICKIFGTDRNFGKVIEVQSIIEALPRLKRAGIIASKGAYVQIRSPFLANWLAKKLLEPHRKARNLLFAEMGYSGKIRLIQRLKSMRTSDKNWQFLFRKKNPKGPLCDFQSALMNTQILIEVVHAQPEKISELIEGGLHNKSVESRRGVTGAARLALVSSLEALLYHEKTRPDAILNLALLAEAEVDDHAYNATSVFVSYFYPNHPQATWSFKERIQVLERIIFSEIFSVRLRDLGILATESAVHPFALPIVVQSTRSDKPLDPPFRSYPLESLNYLEDLLGVLETAADVELQTLAAHASAVLPKANTESAISMLKLPTPTRRLERIVRRFEKLVASSSSNRTVPILNLDGAMAQFNDLVAQNIEQRSNVTLTELRKAPDFATASDHDLSEVVAEIKRSILDLKQFKQEIEKLRGELRQGGFHTRLKLWAGAQYEHTQWFLLEDEVLSEAARNLASELLADPAALDEDSVKWLCSDEAKRADIFFKELGKLDMSGRTVDAVRFVGTLNTPQSIENFARYLQGKDSTKRGSGSNLLYGFIRDGSINSEAILAAMAYLGYSKRSYEELIHLLRDGIASPASVARVAFFWIEDLTGTQYYELMELIAGPTLENAAIAISSLKLWHMRGGAIFDELAQLAWSCFESRPLIPHAQAYEYDSLASTLAKKEPARGLALLKRILERPSEEFTVGDNLEPILERWDPLSVQGPHSFWNALCEVDVQKTLNYVLQVGIDHPQLTFRVTSGLRNVINRLEATQTLIDLAFKSREHAWMICSSITTETPGFWTICCNIIEHFPDDKQIQDALISSVTYLNGYVGQLQNKLRTICQKVAHLKADTSTPTQMKAWIGRLEPVLKSEIEHLTDVEEY